MIKGSVKASIIKQIAKETGQPVVYYFVSSRKSHQIIKRVAFPEGHAKGENDGIVGLGDGDGIIRFTNYWFAYAHQCRLKRQDNGES